MLLRTTVVMWMNWWVRGGKRKGKRKRPPRVLPPLALLKTLLSVTRPE